MMKLYERKQHLINFQQILFQIQIRKENSNERDSL